MNFWRIIALRISMGLAVAWGVMTTIFAMFTLTDDWVLNAELAILRFADTEEEVIEAVRDQYLMQRGLDRPLWEVYLDWMGNMVLLDWGESFNTGEPAFTAVSDAVIRTGMYILPALGIAIAIGILIGLYAALYRDKPLSNSGVLLAYLLFVIPMFWVGGMMLALNFPDSLSPDYSHWLYDHALPILLTTAALLGGYVSYARAHSLEYVGRDFTKLVKAKGGNNVLIAKHVLRNAAIPFFSMLFTEAMALILLGIFVIEAVFGIDGFGMLLLDSIRQRDLPLIMGGMLYIIAFGVIGNIIQDLSYSHFDPRVDTGARDV